MNSGVLPHTVLLALCGEAVRHAGHVLSYLSSSFGEIWNSEAPAAPKVLESLPAFFGCAFTAEHGVSLVPLYFL